MARSSATANAQLVYNLRFRWKEELKEYTDIELVAAYDEFNISDMWGNNDERFLEFMKDWLF